MSYHDAPVVVSQQCLLSGFAISVGWPKAHTAASSSFGDFCETFHLFDIDPVLDMLGSSGNC
jgi:hypothetical protein